MRVALAQICTGPDVDANLGLVRRYTEEAAARNADLVVFPEATMCAFGNDLGAMAEPLDGRFARAVAACALEHDITIAVGMFTPGDGDRVRNTLFITDGSSNTSYDKVHLFDAFGYQESNSITPGDSVVRFDCDGMTFGLAICYDVRFPQLFITNAMAGANAHLLSASWGAGDRKIEQWQLLVQARALDSTSYVIACGQADPQASDVTPVPGAPTGVGHSMVVSPLGEILARAGEAPELMVVDLDEDSVSEARRTVPVLENARPL